MEPPSDLNTARLLEPEKDNIASVMDLLLNILSRLDAQQNEMDKLKATRKRVSEGTSTLAANQAHGGSSRGCSSHRAYQACAS